MISAELEDLIPLGFAQSGRGFSKIKGKISSMIPTELLGGLI